MESVLPAQIIRRVKQPFRAPLPSSFLADLGELLSDRHLRQSNLFEPRAVGALRKKLENSGELGERDTMAVVGVASTLLLHDQLVASPPSSTSPQLRFARFQRAPIAGGVS
jgi:asparagine synthase (glutamine-hydrolysing)